MSLTSTGKGPLATMIGLLKRGDLKDLMEVLSYAARRKWCDTRYKPEIYDRFSAPSCDLRFDSIPNPLVTIVIPCHNQWEYTRSCLYAILRNTQGVPYEIIVADDASTDAMTEIESTVTGISLVRNATALGFLLNCNNAVGMAKGKYLLFLNNDTNVQKGWLEALLKCAELDARIGIVGPKLVYPNGKLQEAGGIVWNDASGWNYGRGDDPESARYNFPREADYVSGACLMIKRALWDEIGGFDPRYAPAYYEDTDIAFEVRQRGYLAVYQPESVVVHFEGASCGTDTGHGIKSYQKSNRDKFYKKWQAVLQRGHFHPGQLGLAVKALRFEGESRDARTCCTTAIPS